MPRSALLVAAVVALAALAVFLFVRPGLPTGPQPPPQPVPPPRPERCFLVIEGPEGYPVKVNGTEYALPVRLEYPCPLARFELLANETYRLNDTARYEFKAWRLGEKRVESRAARLTAAHNTTLTLEAELVKVKKREKPKLKAVPAREAIDWGKAERLEECEEGQTCEWRIEGYTVYNTAVLVKLPLKRPLRIVRIENVKVVRLESLLHGFFIYLVYAEPIRVGGVEITGVYIAYLYPMSRDDVVFSTFNLVPKELPRGEYVYIKVHARTAPLAVSIDLEKAFREAYLEDLGLHPWDAETAYLVVEGFDALDFSEAVFWVAEED